MTVAERVNALRSLLHEKDIHGYIITSSDPHMSEYVPDRWETRQWLSGFTGSAGTLVITQENAGLWTDSRYFLQAEKQLAGSGITLYKMGIPGTATLHEWLSTELPLNPNVGFDGSCFSVAQTRELKVQLGGLGIHIVEEYDLVNEIWADRPELPNHLIYNHEICYSGQSRSDKLIKIRNYMKKCDCNFHFVGSLDDIAWIFNLRGSDIDYNPLALAYALIGTESTTLYLSESNISNDLIQKLAKDKIHIADYSQICADLMELQGSSSVLLDANRTNLNIFNSISANIHERENPSQLLKSIKNEVEIEGIKKAMKKDGVALVQFYFWLEKNIGETKITEFTVMKKLKEFRALQENFKGESFGSIVGYKDHGAHPHYSTTAETDVELKAEGLLLIDSGAQYLEGTTDITRTIPLGELNEEEKTDFTLVLKGMIQLAMAKFPMGTRGCNLDILARQALWNKGKNYGHGTGHGVGCFMNVHEGPQSIRQELKEQAILPGMITSDEPGFYRDGFYGIRHENLILCCNDETTSFGDFLKFETITLCPFETKGILPELLTAEEKQWLNDYHEDVYNKLSSKLDEQHQIWLRKKTKAI
jgi:Xaa-Pro aminopeptidase